MIGLGYVGLPLAVAFAKRGLAVTGIDTTGTQGLAWYDAAGAKVTYDPAGRFAYLATGQTWDRFEALDLGQTKLEAGFELTVSGQMFGGLLPFEITGGVAVALQGAPDPEKKTLEPYLMLNVPLF